MPTYATAIMEEVRVVEICAACNQFIDVPHIGIYGAPGKYEAPEWAYVHRSCLGEYSSKDKPESRRIKSVMRRYDLKYLFSNFNKKEKKK